METLTPQQKYNLINKEKIRMKAKERYENDEEYRNKIKQMNSIQYNKRKLEGKNFNEYHKVFKEKHPDYYKDYLKDYNPVYYQTNREKILKDVGQKILCDCCLKQVRKDYFNKHIKKPYHIKNELKHKETITSP